MNIVEAFSGIGAQSKALSNINVEYNVLATIEWEMGAIFAYDIIHNGPQDLSPYDGMSKEVLIEKLSKLSLSSDGKDPIKISSLNRYPLEALKRITASVERTNNLVSIMDVKGSQFTDQIDLLTYSFPCQDLSLSGSWHGNVLGIDRDANNKSSMLWEIERILIEMHENNQPLPFYLMMENVTNIMSARHIDNFIEWQDFLTNKGYFNHIYKLDAENFGIPQRRRRAFMISIFIGDSPDNPNDKLRTMLMRYFEENNLEDYKYSKEINLEDFLRMNYSDPKLRREALSVIPNDTKSRRKIRENNDVLYNGKLGQNFVRTITTKQDRHPNSGIIDLAHDESMMSENKSKFRYLTPRECFLLMGFSEKDFDLLLKENFQYNIGRKFITNEKLNKLAGNSIVVNILERVFEQVIDIDSKFFDNRIEAKYIK